jgi:hypothetical protein
MLQVSTVCLLELPLGKYFAFFLTEVASGASVGVCTYYTAPAFINCVPWLGILLEFYFKY